MTTATLRWIACLALAVAAWAQACDQACAQVTPTTPKKNHHRNPKYTGGAATTTAEDGVWFVPGQDLRGELKPKATHRVWFQATRGAKVTFELRANAVDRIEGRVFRSDNGLGRVAFEEEDGRLVLRDHRIGHTGGYVLSLQNLGDGGVDVAITTSIDWGLELDEAWTMAPGRPRELVLAGIPGRELKELELRGEGASEVSLTLTDPLGDPVDIRRFTRSSRDGVSLRRLELSMLGDYRLEATLPTEAAVDAEVEVVGRLTQRAGPRGTVVIP